MADHAYLMTFCVIMMIEILRSGQNDKCDIVTLN
jgi:hypothetical protein